MPGYREEDLVWVTCAFCRRNKFRVLKHRRTENNYCGLRCKDNSTPGGYRWTGNNLAIRRGKPGRKKRAEAELEMQRDPDEVKDSFPPPWEEEKPESKLDQLKELRQEIDALDIVSYEPELS